MPEEIMLEPEDLIDTLLALFLSENNLNITVKVPSLNSPGQYHFLTFKRLYLAPEPPLTEQDLADRLEEQRFQMLEAMRNEWNTFDDSDAWSTTTEIGVDTRYTYYGISPFEIEMPFDEL